jgi:hypothetical protein
LTHFVSVTIAGTKLAPKKNRGARIKGICADAEFLGVTRMHLWAVLKGHRESKPLLARYTALKVRQGSDPATASDEATREQATQ